MRSISPANFQLLSENVKELIYKTYMIENLSPMEDPDYVGEIKRSLTEEKMKLKSLLRNYDKEKMFDLVNSHIIDFSSTSQYHTLIENDDGDDELDSDEITQEILSKIKLGVHDTTGTPPVRTTNMNDPLVRTGSTKKKGTKAKKKGTKAKKKGTKAKKKGTKAKKRNKI